jgi:D,D-heptose 1,7-bisphosphate phosphatase
MSSRFSNKAVFLDRDGTIIIEKGYLASSDEVELYKGAPNALRMLKDNGFLLIVVTNQSAVARGLVSLDTIENIHHRMISILRKDGIELDGIYYCPHHPTEGINEYVKDCDCRKPGTGLLERAVKEFHIDLQRSYTVGDKLTDIEMAHGLSMKSVLVRTGYGESEINKIEGITPDFIATDLKEAAEWILKAV